MQTVLDLIAKHWTEAIALIALVLAIIQGRNLSKAQERLDRVTEDLTKVVEALPTQPLYAFPGYVPKIAELIEKANGPIIICCDQPAYGSFSDQAGYRRYALALFARISAGKSVKLYCMNEKGRRRNTELQFTQSDEEWMSFRKEKKPLIESYLHTHPRAPVQTVDELKNNDFIELIVHEDTHALQSVFRDAETVHDKLEKKPPVYFWYADNEMIFVVSSDHRKTENGFYTRDRSLIHSLLDVTERYTKQTFRPPLSPAEA